MRNRKIVFILGVVFAAVGGAIAWGGGMWLTPPFRVEVSPAEATGPALSPLMYRVEISNVSRKPIEIVGAQDGCCETHCVRVHTRLPIRIEPGDAGVVRLELMVRDAGSFAITTSVWVATQVVVDCPIVLKGNASPAEPFEKPQE